eukprot:4146468-Amphidinium_carterae.1
MDEQQHKICGTKMNLTEHINKKLHRMFRGVILTMTTSIRQCLLHGCWKVQRLDLQVAGAYKLMKRAS